MEIKEATFLDFLKEISLLNESVSLLQWDSLTGMPKASSEQRGELVSYLYGQAFERENGKEMSEFLSYFQAHPAELSSFGQQVVAKAQENYDANCKIPPKRMSAFLKVASEADEAWRNAREAKDFTIFQPYLEKIIDFQKEFIPLWQKDEKTPYDVLLNRNEPNMTVEILDKVFGELREGIISLRKELAAKGVEPETSFLNRCVPISQQKAFATKVVEQLGYDFKRGRLDDTIHPFMQEINRNDVRITTRWAENDFSMATFGIIHESGHGIYEQNIDEKFDYTPLSGGTSNGIHESQSLFYEIIIGSNKTFWKKQYPLFQEITEGTFDDISFEDFYRGLNQTKASFIRIESDPLTYPLHIIIRYEIEKMIFNEDLAVKDLPKVWNEKYQEYLGITPSNDLEGILQDIHWTDGSFGYFPSYALGFMYAAQFMQAMKKEVNVEEILLSDYYSLIRKWLTKNIHQFGSSKKPNQLLFDATGENLNPQYLLDFLTEVYRDVYQVK